MSRLRVSLLCVALCLVGAASATLRYRPALTQEGVYHSDTRQSPHWAACHTTSFRADDPWIEYARFNESPLQNAIYFVATWFVEYPRVGAWLAILANALSAGTFYLAGRAMYGTRAGVLLSLFFTLFPASFFYSEGFFSKFWACPTVVLCILVLHTGKFRWLALLMPLAALAYPMAAFLIGATCAVQLVTLWFSDRPSAAPLFRALAVGSALAVALLMFKYAAPPEFLGERYARSAILDDPQGGAAEYVPLPSLAEALLDPARSAFVLLACLGYFLFLGRRGVRWEPVWTSLLVASIAAYLAASWTFPSLYIPNRYTRYSLTVLLALWNATNLDAALARIPRPALRHAVLAAVLLAAALLYRDGAPRHVTRSGAEVVELSAFVRTLPEGVLLAGSPRVLDDVMIQAKRSILAPFKLNHGWYSGLQATLHERVLVTFDALYASDPATVNLLYERYGVTHLVVERALFDERLKNGDFRSRYDSEIRERVRGRTDFLLARPPPESVVYDDGKFIVLTLPVPRPEPG